MSEVIEQKVIDIVAETLKLDKQKISPHSKFDSDLGADSLDLVELMMAFDTAFDCEISDEEASKMSTVSDVVKYLSTHLDDSKKG